GTRLRLGAQSQARARLSLSELWLACGRRLALHRGSGGRVGRRRVQRRSADRLVARHARLERFSPRADLDLGGTRPGAGAGRRALLIRSESRPFVSCVAPEISPRRTRRDAKTRSIHREPAVRLGARRADRSNAASLGPLPSATGKATHSAFFGPRPLPGRDG